MMVDRTGFILYTLNYPACVAFYRDMVGLPVMFANETLTCFEFGGSYLMVEIDDVGIAIEQERIRTCLRMNVIEVKPLADKLTAMGVEVSYQEHSWGTVAKFYDPDGNLCAFKDTATFEKQIAEYQAGS